MKKQLFYSLTFLIFLSVLSSCGVSKKKSRYVKETYNEIKQSFPDASVSLVQDSIKVIFPNHIVFLVGSAVVKSTFERKIKRLAVILNKFNKTDLLIIGHTDKKGGETANLTLSQKRANNVKQKILAYNLIESSRLFTWGMGESKPIAGNETELERQMNRRAEFVVLYKEK